MAACSLSEPDVRNEFPAPESKSDPQVGEKHHSKRREECLRLQLLPRLCVKQLLAQGEDAQSSWLSGIANSSARPLTGQGDYKELNLRFAGFCTGWLTSSEGT